MMPFITRYGIASFEEPYLLTLSQNQEEVTGFGEHRVIIDILQDALFEDGKSYSVKYSCYFNPVSVNLLALVFTMVGPLVVAVNVFIH